MKYYCDNARHLICIPYSRENIHKMAENLDIKRCWFHASKPFFHYDIPKKQIERIMNDPRVTVVSSRDIVAMIKTELGVNN